MSDNTNNIHKVKMNNKGKKIYLPTTTYRDQFIQNFKIIYPFNGTEENPATVTINRTYTEPNPFPGYYINVIAEVLYGGKWGQAPWATWNGSSYYSCGIRVMQFEGDITIITGSYCLLESTTYKNNIQGFPFSSVSTEVRGSLPIRLKVWKIGVMD